MLNEISEREDSVVDLTDVEELPDNPLRSNVTLNRRRRRRRPSTSVERNTDEDIEIVDVMEVSQPRITPRRRRRLRQASNEDEPAVVQEKRLTPQERLRLIQEQHARGQVVTTNQPRDENPYQFSFGAFHALHGGPRLMAPHAFHPYLVPHIRNRLARPSFTHQIPPFGLYSNEGFGASIEQSIIDRTLEASMEETSYSKRLDVKSLMLPPPPAEARPGFTRSLASESELVCIKCDQPLAKARDGLTSSAKLQSQKVFARGCGHVYCGQCTYALKDHANKNKACPVADCKNLPARKRGLFREVFM